MTSRDQQENTRKQRLAAALRDNLKRRKAQAKKRASAETDSSAGPHDSAGIGGNKHKPVVR